MERTLLFGWEHGQAVAMHADMAAGTPVGELVSTCARVSGARLEGDLVIWRSTPEGRVAALDPQAAVGSVRLRSGDAVVLRAASSGAPAVPPSRRPETVAELVAVGGPRCGSRWPLAPGSVVLARDGQGDVVVGARAGRRIAVLEVAPGPVVRLAEAAAGCAPTARSRRPMAPCSRQGPGSRRVPT